MKEINSLNISDSWKQKLSKNIRSKSFLDLQKFLETERVNSVIYPREEQMFAAFNFVPFEKVKVVIIGQDPYHGHDQANGLAFSVHKNIKIPPSLRNIYKELHEDIGCDIPAHGDLTSWAKQGVLLLNSNLTVKSGLPASHKNRGWEEFTDNVIKIVSDEKDNVIFILWGKFAQQKIKFIDTTKHHVLEAAHPSPFSAYRGFFGCKHFSRTNELLSRNGSKSINWDIR